MDVNQVLSDLLGLPPEDSPDSDTDSSPPLVPSTEKKTSKGGIEPAFSQWAGYASGKFAPVGPTMAKLPAGIYVPTLISQDTVGFEPVKVHSDNIYDLPDMNTKIVLEEVTRFWSNEERYRQHQLMYKRGLLLYGRPGSGKTVTLKLLMKDIIQRDGLVVVIYNVGLAIAALRALRKVEPERNVILVLEDLDEIIRYNGESSVLSLLDGEDNIDRVLVLATTNHPEKLGARIINRPSRFDRRIKVDMPTIEARKAYLTHATGGGLSPEEVERWASETDGMSIAHLRELVAAVYCLDQPYAEVLARLSDMSVELKEETGFREPERMGFRELSRKDSR